MKMHTLKAARRTLLVAAASAAVLAAVAAPAMAGRWVTGDIQTHSYLTDGKQTFNDVTRNGFSVYGLDYLANSELGGQSTVNPAGLSYQGGVWRWITLSNASFPTVLAARAHLPRAQRHPGPGLERADARHGGVGIVGAGNEPSRHQQLRVPLRRLDTDISRVNEGTKAVTHTEPDPTDPTKTITVTDVPAMPFGKNNVTQADMITALDWLENNYGDRATRWSTIRRARTSGASATSAP